MAVQQLSSGNDDGICLGQDTSDKVAFHGATPIAPVTIATLTSGSLGDANTAINAVLTALRNKGLIQ